MEIKILDKRAALPAYQTAGSAGMDLHALIDIVCTIYPGEVVFVKTGIAIHIGNSGLAAFIYPRSGLSSRNGIVLANGVGVVDSDYTGEIVVALRNISNVPYTIKPLDRIAQLVFQRIYHVDFEIVEEFRTVTERASGGFGSTGG